MIPILSRLFPGGNRTESEEEMSDFRAVIHWCLSSLETEPDAWEPYFIGGILYHVTHRNGIQIWLANGHYGLAISNKSGARIGDISVASAFFGWAIPWRRAIRAAAVRAGGAYPAPGSLLETIGKAA